MWLLNHSLLGSASKRSAHIQLLNPGQNDKQYNDMYPVTVRNIAMELHIKLAAEIAQRAAFETYEHCLGVILLFVGHLTK